MTTKTIKLEVWSDVACPWCFVGKRRLEAALAEYADRDEVELTWRSFELDPAAPRVRDVDTATHLADKYGMTREEALERQGQLAELAAADGITMRHDIAKGGNTFDAHRLTHLAAAHGLQDAMVERLMLAYHSEGRAIGDPAELAALAIEVGLPDDEVHEVLESDRYADAVREDERLASGFGITAVPFFAVDRSIGGAGAQPPEVIRELLDRGRERAA